MRSLTYSLWVPWQRGSFGKLLLCLTYVCRLAKSPNRSSNVFKSRHRKAIKILH